MSTRITGALLFSASVAFSIIVTTVSTSYSSNVKQNNKEKSSSIDATSVASKEEHSISAAKPLSCKATPIESTSIETVIINNIEKLVEKKVDHASAEPAVKMVSEISIEEPVKKTEKAVSSTKETSRAVAPASLKAKEVIAAPAIIQRPEASFSGSASVDLSAAIDVEDEAPW
jgi:uncharacterized Zn finger protein